MLTIHALNKFFLFNRFQFPLLTECMENLSWVEVKLFSFLKDSCISLQQPSCISFYSVIYIHRINIVIVINSLLFFCGNSIVTIMKRKWCCLLALAEQWILFCLLVLPDSMLEDKIANCILACSDSDCKAFMQLDKFANKYLLPVCQDGLLLVQTIVLFYIYIYIFFACDNYT